MKFQSAIVGVALVIAALESTSAFQLSSSLRRHQIGSTHAPLEMVATSEIVNGEVNGVSRPRRTREVSVFSMIRAPVVCIYAVSLTVDCCTFRNA